MVAYQPKAGLNILPDYRVDLVIEHLGPVQYLVDTARSNVKHNINAEDAANTVQELSGVGDAVVEPLGDIFQAEDWLHAMLQEVRLAKERRAEEIRVYHDEEAAAGHL